jgi:hypothetical protein
MPTPVETLWNHMAQRQYLEIKRHIEAHPTIDLINSINPKNRECLVSDLLRNTSELNTPAHKELRRFLLTHPKLNWDIDKKQGSTIIYSVLIYVCDTQDYALLKNLKGVAGFVCNKHEIAYINGIENLKEAESWKEDSIQEGEPQEKLDEDEEYLNVWKTIVATLRDITLLHAIETDDSKLYNILINRGANVKQNFGDVGNYANPESLISKENTPKIMAYTEESERETNNRNRYKFHMQKKTAIENNYAEQSNQEVKRATEEAKQTAAAVANRLDQKPTSKQGKGGCSIM